MACFPNAVLIASALGDRWLDMTLLTVTFGDVGAHHQRDTVSARAPQSAKPEPGTWFPGEHYQHLRNLYGCRGSRAFSILGCIIAV